jgi:hypothetical protein
MRRSIIFFIAVFTGMGTVSADDLQCLRYTPEAFVASDRWVPPGEAFHSTGTIFSVESVYVIKLPVSKQKNLSNTIGIVVKADGNIYRKYNLDCTWEKGTYYCRGECDTGQVWLDTENRLRFTFVTYSKEGEEGPQVLLELRPKDTERWIKGRKIPCPEEVREGNYVCYGKKEKGKYLFCQRSRLSCQTKEMQHFGYYPDESSVRAALMRCMTSTPFIK